MRVPSGAVWSGGPADHHTEGARPMYGHHYQVRLLVSLLDVNDRMARPMHGWSLFWQPPGPYFDPTLELPLGVGEALVVSATDGKYELLHVRWDRTGGISRDDLIVYGEPAATTLLRARTYLARIEAENERISQLLDGEFDGVE